VATDCESEAQRAAWQLAGLPDRFFRFSIAYSAGEICPEVWRRTGELAARTVTYLKDAVVSQTVDRLVKWLCEGRAAGGPSGPEVTLSSICTANSSCTRSMKAVQSI
jgi:hypothetical protein